MEKKPNFLTKVQALQLIPRNTKATKEYDSLIEDATNAVGRTFMISESPTQQAELLDKIQKHHWKIIKVPDFFTEKDRERYLGRAGKLFSPTVQGFNFWLLAKKFRKELLFEGSRLIVPWEYQGNKDTVEFEMAEPTTASFLKKVRAAVRGTK
jgi:hypothetical protein